MIRRPPRSTRSLSSAASDVYKRQLSLSLPPLSLSPSLSLLSLTSLLLCVSLSHLSLYSLSLFTVKLRDHEYLTYLHLSMEGIDSLRDTAFFNKKNNCFTVLDQQPHSDIIDTCFSAHAIRENNYIYLDKTKTKQNICNQ